ncbi:MAG TPA: 4-hydroxybenzoate octaprenyltransferase [Hypericibacter adhaerens]|uniref:4-hydroxybenzoate octaprenyltransferase n=1 Tax=Hypericibacter adhaerens TaxID=2602016 RepID=UPI002BD9CDB0|nr:4-hydroxybenzoate octaprenyltransferase [Hypericibacter adhaerens]HWA45892.1 4-hydroxybenzoate octaprenyltransferase [Hypericibacter adhaerens]
MPSEPHTAPPQAGPFTDIHRGNWVDRLLPASVAPYARLARLDRPIGTWLLLFPGWWSLALTSPAKPDLWLMALFAVGALLMRGAGCTVNDIVDREFDAKVARTATRPIPSGAVSVHNAVIFLGLQLLLALIVLLQLDRFAIALGVASLALVATYPFMKRITYWPQAFLGLTFNWGALLGWAAATGSLAWPPVLLYAGGIAWTLFYDTIYAHQDKEDDALIGVKSTALKLGSATRPWLILFGTVTVLLWALAFVGAGLGWPAYVGLAAAALFLADQVRRTDLDDPADCRAKFNAHRWLGWMLLAGILLSPWLG